MPHSFPKRRSSDLYRRPMRLVGTLRVVCWFAVGAARAQVQPQQLQQPQQTSQLQPQALQQPLPQQQPTHLPAVVVVGGRLTDATPASDRKSTRLNYSH